jgi:hypothetical protein
MYLMKGKLCVYTDRYIQGLLTLIIGILGFGLMPAAPTKTASWLRGRKGWFTER